MKLKTYLDAMLIARNDRDKGVEDSPYYEKRDNHFKNIYYGISRRLIAKTLKEEQYRDVISFLLNQISGMTGDGEEFDFEMAEEELSKVGFKMNDYFIY